MSDLKKLAKDLRVDLSDDLSFDELKASLQQNGWSHEFPAILDEHGTVLVGNRRMKAAKELKIAPVTKTLTFGKGDAADAERVKLALISNLGVKPMTAKDRQHIAQHLYGNKQWTMQRIAEALNTTHKTISKDLSGFVPKVQTPRPKGGRPKAPPKPKPIPLTPEQRRAAQRHLDESVTMDKAATEAGFSSTVMRRVKAAVQAERETEERIRARQAEAREVEHARAESAMIKHLREAVGRQSRYISTLEKRIKELEARELPEITPEEKKELTAYRRKIRHELHTEYRSRIAHNDARLAEAKRIYGCMQQPEFNAILKAVRRDTTASEDTMREAQETMLRLKDVLLGQPAPAKPNGRAWTPVRR